MPLPDSEDQKNLDLIYEGQPNPAISPKGEIDTEDLGYVYEAQPLVTLPGENRITVTDLLVTIDDLNAPQAGSDVGPMIDSVEITAATIVVEDFLYTPDEAVGIFDEDLNLNFSVILKVVEDTRIQGSQIIKISEDLNNDYSTSLNVISNNLALVTNASSAMNPVTPTLILNGVPWWSNPGTLPPNGLANARCYVNWKCDAIAGQSLGNLFNWNLSMSGGGGTWKTISTTDYGDFGEEKSVFGILGTITEKGREKSGSAFAYSNGGILGKAKLNKPMAFLIAGNQNFTTMIPSQSLALPDPSNWQTYQAAVQALASATDISVQYNVLDYPLTDFSAQAGQTGLEALNSLAENVGAKLRRKNDTEYIINYPNDPTGLYEIPDCCLVQAITKRCHLDIKTGIYSPGVYTLYQLPQFDAGTINLPNGPTNPLVTNPTNDFQVEEIWTSSKLLTPEDPAFPIDLPFDWDTVYVQSITVTDGGGQFVTTNPKRWFLLQTGFAGSWINYNDVGGVLKPQVTINWTLFSQTNQDMADGHFIFKVGVKRKNLSGQLQQSANSPDIEKQTLARTQQRYRFIPACEYNITVVFSGALPFDGFEIRGGIGDFQIEPGTIIESVDFSNPGILNITAVQWAEIQFYTNYTTMGQQ